MLIVKFAIRGSKITSFIHDNWTMVLSFLLTMVLGIIYRNKKIKNWNKNIQIPDPKVWAFIYDCIEPDSIYELVNRPTKIVLKQMLNLRPEAGPIIISV